MGVGIISNMLSPDQDQIQQRERVLDALLAAVRENQTVKLPPFDPNRSLASPTALITVGIEPNTFGGTVGEFRYQFEGEEDLLHLFITRQDFSSLSVKDAQGVFSWLLPSLPPAQIWLKPGENSQHFYFGHELLLANA